MANNMVSDSKSEGLAILSSTVLGGTGFSSYLGLPVLLGALAEAKGLDERQIGWVGSVELLGLLVGSLVVAPMITRAPLRLLAGVGIAIAILAQLTTVAVDGLAALLLLRLLVGVGGGMCYALALSRLAAFGDPTRNFSLFGLGMVGVGSLELMVLPILSAEGGLMAALLLLILGHIFAAAMLFWLPTGSTAGNANVADKRPASARLKLGYICLVATFVYSVGATSFWAYVERLGAGGGLSPQFIGGALNAANLAGAITCLLTYRIERRWGQAWPQFLSLGACALVFVTWSAHAGAAEYAGRAFAYFQLLTISQILQQAVLSRTDPLGRQAALLPAFQGAGLAIGPLFGATILSAGLGYEGKLAIEAGTLLIAAGLFAAVYWLLGRAGSIASQAKPTSTGDAAKI